jgi:transposase InsO family protein
MNVDTNTMERGPGGTIEEEVAILKREWNNVASKLAWLQRDEETSKDKATIGQWQGLLKRIQQAMATLEEAIKGTGGSSAPIQPEIKKTEHSLTYTYKTPKNLPIFRVAKMNEEQFDVVRHIEAYEVLMTLADIPVAEWSRKFCGCVPPEDVFVLKWMINNVTSRPWDEARAAIIEHYQTPNLVEVKREQLRAMRMKPYESLSIFADRFQLAREDARMDEATSECMRMFVSALNRRYIEYAVTAEESSKTVTELITKVINHFNRVDWSLAKSPSSERLSAKVASERTDRRFCTVCQSSSHWESDCWKKRTMARERAPATVMTSRVSPSTSKNQGFASDRVPAGKYPNSTSNKCTHCGMIGHLESNCWRKHPHLRMQPNKPTRKTVAQLTVANPEYVQPENGKTPTRSVQTWNQDEPEQESDDQLQDKKCPTVAFLESVSTPTHTTPLTPNHFQISKDRLLVPIQIEGTNLMALYDTGSQVSVISEQLAQGLCATQGRLPCNLQITMAQRGAQCKTLGRTPQLRVKAGDKTVQHSFVILELPDNLTCLLGFDLVRAFGFSFGGLPIQFPDQDPDPDPDPNFSQGGEAMKREGSSSTNLARVSTSANQNQSQSINPKADGEVAPEDEYMDPSKDPLKPRLEENEEIKDRCNLPIAKVQLNTGVSPPSHVSQYRIAQRMLAETELKISNWIDQMIVVRAPPDCRWNSPLLAVQKKDVDGKPTKVRVCLDPRHINSKLEDDQFPIPIVSELLDRIAGAWRYTLLDLKESYHQLTIVEADQQKTAFTWKGTQYMFKGAPFGLKTLPNAFQRVMSHLFGSLHFVVTFIDDIIIFSQDDRQHLDQVCEVLDILNKNNLKLNTEKCKFGYTTIRVLGHLVSREGIRPDRDKMQAVAAWPHPRTGKDIQCFLGLCNYLRKSIPRFASVAQPLDGLRQCGKITAELWTGECEEAFNSLKALISEAPMLSCPDFDRHFYVATDASAYGIGAILFQDKDKETALKSCSETRKFIAFASRSLKGAERNYSATKRELLSVIYALNRFEYFISGRKFTVITDHQALVYLHTQKHTNAMMNGWLDILLDFDFQIEHIAGTTNVLPDALSRLFPSFVIEADILRISVMTATTTTMETQEETEEHHLTEDCSPCEEEKRELLQTEHFLGHVHHDTLFKKLFNQGYGWKGMRKDCIDFCAACPECLRVNVAKYGYHPLTPIHASLPFDHLAIDLIGPLPTTKDDFSLILIVIDVFTRFVLLRPLKDKRAVSIATELFKIFVDFGHPRIIQSDNGLEFVNNIIASVMKLYAIDKRVTVPYHPRANGIVERSVRTTLALIKKSIQGEGTDWKRVLPSVQLMVNNRIASIHGSTPFSVMFARKLNPFRDFEDTENLATISEEAISKRLSEITSIIFPTIDSKMRENLNKIKGKWDQKPNHNVDFAPGTVVMLRNPVRSNKLDADFLGPFKILRKTRGGSYVLADACGTLLGKNVAPSQLKLVTPTALDSRFYVDTIVDHKTSETDGQMWYRVRWLGFPPESDTWEPVHHFDDPATIREYWKRRSGPILEGGDVNDRPLSMDH